MLLLSCIPGMRKLVFGGRGDLVSGSGFAFGLLLFRGFRGRLLALDGSRSRRGPIEMVVKEERIGHLCSSVAASWRSTPVEEERESCSFGERVRGKRERNASDAFLSLFRLSFDSLSLSLCPYSLRSGKEERSHIEMFSPPPSSPLLSPPFRRHSISACGWGNTGKERGENQILFFSPLCSLSLSLSLSPSVGPPFCSPPLTNHLHFPFRTLSLSFSLLWVCGGIHFVSPFRFVSYAFSRISLCTRRERERALRLGKQPSMAFHASLHPSHPVSCAPPSFAALLQAPAAVQPAQFLMKLYKMVDGGEREGRIRWAEDGRSFFGNQTRRAQDPNQLCSLFLSSWPPPLKLPTMDTTHHVVLFWVSPPFFQFWTLLHWPA